MLTDNPDRVSSIIPNPWLELFADARPGDKFAKLVKWENDSLPSLLQDADKISAGPKPFHSGSVLGHMARCMNECAGDPLAVWFAMAHDAGKLSTPKSMLPHHYGHEKRGGDIAILWAMQMNLPPDWGKHGEFAACQHMRAAKFFRMRPGKKLDLLKRIAQKGIANSFWKLIDADTKHNYSAIMLPLGERVAEWEGLPEQRQIGLLAELCKNKNI